MSNDNLKFVTNNVKGLQSTYKRLKMFEYFRNILSPNGIIFLQETHSSINGEKNWCDEFKGGTVFFSWKNQFLWLCYWVFRISAIYN